MRTAESLSSAHETPHLTLVYRDDALVVIDKPSGVMTHKSRLAEDDEPSAMERLRDQLGQWVYPVHRLDRATSGLLVFALSQEYARRLHGSFERGEVEKRYWAVTRGHAPAHSLVDRALKEKRDRVTDQRAALNKAPQEAKTTIETLAHSTLDIPLGRYPTARFSLVEARPHTGRRHQIRRHLAGLNYPIIGDTTHGRGEQNRFFRSHFDCHRLLLAAVSLTLPHPHDERPISVESQLSGVMSSVCQRLFMPSEVLNHRQVIENLEPQDVQSQELYPSTLTWLREVNDVRQKFAALQA